MQRNYTKLSFEDFGAHLLTSGDLDPIYIALNRCAFAPEQRNRWLTAYCAFYNAGFACWASDEVDAQIYWNKLMIAAKNEVPTPFGERWPRAKERRHFRGQQAVQGIVDWSSKYAGEPGKMFDYIGQNSGGSFDIVLKRAQQHRSVGNWLGFKMVDLVDACMGIDIGQSDVMHFMYEAPRVSLLNRWREKNKLPPEAKPKDEKATILAVVDYCREAFKSYEVPHKPNRPVDMFCLETIFCKFQSHLNGHYPLNNDLHEISEGLAPWLPHSSAARLFDQEMRYIGVER